MNTPTTHGNVENELYAELQGERVVICIAGLQMEFEPERHYWQRVDFLWQGVFYSLRLRLLGEYLRGELRKFSHRSGRWRILRKYDFQIWLKQTWCAVQFKLPERKELS